MTQKPNGKLEGNPRFDHLVEQFITVRDKVEALETAFEKNIAKYKDLKEQLNARLLDALSAAGVEAARTKYGTVTTMVRHTAPLHDPTAFMKYVIEQEAFYLMERRASEKACRDHVEEHGCLPPGVSINSRRYARVQKPTGENR